MPTPTGVGNTSFREVARNITVNRAGLDNMTVTLKGRSALLSATWNNYTRGKADSTYTSMFLDSKSYTDQGPVAEITLNYIGFVEPTTGTDKIEVDDSITEQSVTLNTDADEDVTFRYFAQSTTTRWIYRGFGKPTKPKYRGTVPSSINIGNLFQPNPPKYEGSIAGRYKVEGRLAAFARTLIAPSVWAVVETWENYVEPESDSESE